MSSRNPLPKKMLVHRQSRRLLESAVENDDGTFNVVYLDPIPGQVDFQSNVPADDVIGVVNSWDLAQPGDWTMRNENSAAFPFELSRKQASVEQFADDVATFHRGGLSSSSRHGSLRFRSWEAMCDWAARKGVAPHGWTVDRAKTKAWVPVGDRRAANRSPHRPCQAAFAACDRPVPVDDAGGLCGRHAAGKKRSDAKQAEWDARWAASEEQAERDEMRRLSAAAWAVRFREQFGISVEPVAATGQAGKVAVSPEGLHGLLATVEVELRQVGIDLADLVPIELRHRESGPDS